MNNTTNMAATPPVAVALALPEIEQRIREKSAGVCQSLFDIGEQLALIRDGRLYEHEGFKNWGDYCSSGRLDFTKRRADQLIRAVEVRDVLPTLPKVGTRVPTWTERAIRELTRLPAEDDIQRVGKEVAKLVEESGAFSSKLVRQLVDADLGIPEQRKQRREHLDLLREQVHQLDRDREERERKRADEAALLTNQLDQLLVRCSQLADSLAPLALEDWRPVDDEDRETRECAAQAMQRLADLLIKSCDMGGAA